MKNLDVEDSLNEKVVWIGEIVSVLFLLEQKGIVQTTHTEDGLRKHKRALLYQPGSSNFTYITKV